MLSIHRCSLLNQRGNISSFRLKGVRWSFCCIFPGVHSLQERLTRRFQTRPSPGRYLSWLLRRTTLNTLYVSYSKQLELWYIVKYTKDRGYISVWIMIARMKTWEKFSLLWPKKLHPIVLGPMTHLWTVKHILRHASLQINGAKPGILCSEQGKPPVDFPGQERLHVMCHNRLKWYSTRYRFCDLQFTKITFLYFSFLICEEEMVMYTLCMFWELEMMY